MVVVGKWSLIRDNSLWMAECQRFRGPSRVLGTSILRSISVQSSKLCTGPQRAAAIIVFISRRSTVRIHERET